MSHCASWRRGKAIRPEAALRHGVVLQLESPETGLAR
jgi:hypothetical protein